MDTYDLFGEDGPGMLEGLPDLGGDHFEPAVTGARDAPQQQAAAAAAFQAAAAHAQQQQQQQQPTTYSQESPLQKLATFGGQEFSAGHAASAGHMDPNAQSVYAQQGYGAERPMGPPGYTHQRQMARPPVPPQSAAASQYPGYQTQDNSMYSMPDHQMGGGGMTDTASMQAAAWGQHSAAGYPSMHRYGQMAAYRQQSMSYGHQQEQPKQQFPPSQHPMMQQPHQAAAAGYASMQQRHAPSHYTQNAYPTAAAAQGYGNYMHQRMPHHHAPQYPQSHHQMEMNQPQPQQYNHMSHAQALSGHMQQTHAPQTHNPATQQPPSQNPMAHMTYPQQHQTMQQAMQRPMDIPPTTQQFAAKHTGPMGNASPQYRAPFPQLSPQISPRPQMSPRPQAPQMSPRPVMSPAKPNLSPHPQMPGPVLSTHSPRPATSLTPKSTTTASVTNQYAQQQSTLQALEQMVMPPSSTTATEYPNYRNTLGPPQPHANPVSPAMNRPMEQWASQQQQQQHRSHLSAMNGNMNMMDPSQMNPTNISAPPQQNLHQMSASVIQQQQSQAMQHMAFATEELRPPDITNKPQITDLNPIQAATVQAYQQQQPPQQVMHQLSDINSVQSPASSIPDKLPSSTTNTEVNIPTSMSLPTSHPTTPTPSSTTDDHNTSLEKCLPVTCDSIKDDSNSNSSMQQLQQQQPTQSQNNFDFANMYAQTQKASKMDDLMPSMYQETSLHSDSANESQSPTVQPQMTNAVSINVSSNVSISSQSSQEMTSPLINSTMCQSPATQTPPPLPVIPQNQPTIPQQINLQNQLNLPSQPIQQTEIIPPTSSTTTELAPLITPISQITQINQMTPQPITSIPMITQPAPIYDTNLIGHNQLGYQPPISHHQERAALQQQLQELYCMQPAPEHQEKILHLQERLNVLTQHENMDQCNGGPQCVLQSPLFTSPMIDSPQVSSTTGRGRGKGTPRTKKPRQKKGEKSMSPVNTTTTNAQQLPVSEDCVTPGAGLTIPSEEITELNDPGTDSFSGDETEKIGKKKVRKQREPKKPKEPKIPKEPKTPKTPKRKKAKEGKDPKSPKRKYVRRKKDGSLDDSASEDNKSFENGDEIETSNVESTQIVESSESVPESTNADEELATPQADSQSAIDEVTEGEGDTKKDEYAFDDATSPKEPYERKKRTKVPAKKVVSTKAKKSSGTSSKKRRKGQMVTESDGEGEDLASTPPPSPPEDDNSTHKRRSARNTQRKKYIDDVMLRFSDDESPAPSRSKRSNQPPSTPPIASSVASPGDETPNADSANKPNFVYINTGDEDSMVVQYVLTSRIGKREKKKIVAVPPPEEKPKKDDENEEEEEEKVDVEDEDETKIEVDKPEDEEKKIDEEEPEKLEVEPIETCKLENKDIDKDKGTTTTSEENKEKEMQDVEEFYVKYRNFSYLHCEWRTEEELYKGDKRIANKIKRFKQKQAQQLNIFENLEDEHFNPDYVEVDRVLDVAEHTDPHTSEKVKHYLVKWRSLQYEDCTWELEEDVDPLKIEQFERFRQVPPRDKWKLKKRPNPDSWTKLEKSPIYKAGNSLREYQLEGLNWLLFSWYNGRNCILADEMGLGKTIQSLTFINSVHELGIRGPFLVIAPLSTIPNWQREIEGWTDMNVIVYHGSAASRNMIQEYEMWYKNEKTGQPIKDLTKFNVLITTFEIIVTDFADLKGFNWRLCVIDEAHRLKNRNCKLLEGLRQLTLEHRVLLSGTPLQNNVNELFSLLNFLEPTQFPSSEQFLQEFGALKSEQEVSKLQVLLKPMMLRRLKEDVEKSLAPKQETVVEVELTNIQKKYYRGILERNFSFLSKGTTHANIPNLMNTMMELRKCCIHPYLLNGAEDQIQYDYKQQHGEDIDAYYKALIQSSGKMVLIDKLLSKLKANGHRVLIFSQMVRCLDILEDYLVFKKYPFERIDGRIRGNLRQAAIDRFSRPDSDRFVFLLCTKAGGLGINLTAADTVIIYDSDWNPQNDLQAQARCHRIGQQKMVKIYRLLCRNTYEREMFDKASLKLGLDKAILQSMNTSQGGKDTGNRQLSKKEIEDLLKKGAYGALLDEEKESDKFCEEDIDIILARRTQVITMESEKGSTFSKATFAASANRSDINIDDPDFWNKWAKKAEIDTTEKDETEDLVISEPRRRTQIKRYGHDESAIDMSELESSSDTDAEGEGGLGLSRSRRNKLKKKKLRGDDYVPREGERGEIVYGSWARRECFMIERGLLTFGWGRWQEILTHSQLRKGWREQDVEDCARVILLYCLRFYRGDEKIRSFIWDLITPSENGEQKMRNHHGLKDPVPRGIRNKNKKKGKDTRHAALTDPNHWSKSEKYDGDIFLESNYKKHLGRHANKLLLRVRLLYYIKHEIIGDLVQHIADGVNASALPITPPVTEQLPCAWWDSECDKSLLVGTWKHGYESYTEMRADPNLCFLSRCGPPTARELQMAASGTEASTPALNDDDLDDDDTNEELSVKSKQREGSEQNSEFAEPSPGPSGSSETQPPGDVDEAMDIDEQKNQWPSVTDLNTRLRRVITSYQRNYRREEQKMAAARTKQPSLESALSNPLAALAQVSQQLERGGDLSQLAGVPGWDIQQLALYLLMERQGKQLEQQMRDKERNLCIAKRWTRREEADFFRVASSYGVIYSRKKKAYDWIKFKQLSKLEKKTDEDLTEYYKSFVMMCRKQTGIKSEDENYDTSIDHLTEEKSRRTLERLELLSRIREEVIIHPKLDERLKVCLTSADMPEWWIPGKHDKDLLLGVAKHGLGRTDYYILNDPEFSFHEILRRKVTSESQAAAAAAASDTKDAIKLESTEDILKFDENEILVKLEKGEGTLKIEKVGVKKESEKPVIKEEKVEESKVEVSLVKPESEKEEDDVEKKEDLADVEKELEEKTIDDEDDDEKDEEEKEEKKEEEDETMKVDEKEKEVEENEDGIEDKKPDAEAKEEVAEELTVDKDEKIEDKKPTRQEDPEDLATKPGLLTENKEDFTKENDLCSKQAAELKAMFPDLEVIQPLSRLSQIDTFVLRDQKPGAAGAGALDFSETTVAQLFNNAVKWPKEYAIQVRLQHIIYALDTKEWPVSKTFSAYASGIGNEFDIPIHEIPNEPATAKRDTSTPLSATAADTEVITITTDSLNRGNATRKRGKRHIAIDVETDRAKLHALLNNSHGMQNPMAKHSMAWENEDSEDSRRSTPISGSMQPPPAHQQTPRMMGMPFDLKYPMAKTIGQTTVIPGTSSTLTPIDLSSGLGKSTGLDCSKTSNQDIQNEVQDFSMPSKKQQSTSSTTITPAKTAHGGNKLDDTLSKLMKRKNCPEPEPVVGKEKKRRKLDEIVLGLSAAKEQSLFPDPTKKLPVTPSVTVTPTSVPITSHAPTQKPFTITVTSVPSTSQSTPRSLQNILPSVPTGGKDSFATFLQQTEQQNLMLKKQQLQQRKSYEAMIADINKVADYSSKVNSYSHVAKVNNWLADQSVALAEQPLGADYLAQRRRRPRVDPTLLDWKKLTGDENVSVVNRMTGKKLTGPKAPSLKRLGQWLMENPTYDIDPKWSELVKERGNLSIDLQKRLQGGTGSSAGAGGSNSKRGTPGRPPVLSSPTGSTSSVSSANLATSMANNLNFPGLAGANLSGINSSLLSGLSSLGQFDPKNPLLMPFATGMPNMNALSSMTGLNNLSNINLFANLAGLGIPGLAGMDPSMADGSKSSKNKAQNKPAEAHSSSKPSTSTSGSMPTTNPFPFFFPNPSLLYTPLGLGSLSPFSLQPGMAYDMLAQQSGLLNGNMGQSATPGKQKSSRPSTATTTTTSSGKAPKSMSREAQHQHQLQQLFPHDTHLLENLTKMTGSLDPMKMASTSSSKKEDKRKALENLRGMLPTDFTISADKKDPKKISTPTIPGIADFSKLFDSPMTSKKSQEQHMKDTLEQLTKTNEFLARAMAEQQHHQMLAANATASSGSHKRPRETPEKESPIPATIQLPATPQPTETNEPPAKKLKEDDIPIEKPKEPPTPPPQIPQTTESVDIETLLPSNVVKPPEPAEEKIVEEVAPQIPESKEEPQEQKQEEPTEVSPKKGPKRRGKRKSGELPIDPESIREKKNLRSSASRSAAAAAARAEREQAAAKLESEKLAQESKDS